MSCIIPPNDGKGGLYLGNFISAKNLENLEDHDIKAVLTASREITLKLPIDENYVYKKLDL